MNFFTNKTRFEVAGLPRWKRAMDVSFILLAMPVLLPLVLLIPVIIRLVSKGPVLFPQERVGYLGGKFMCLKFRTMIVGAGVVSHQGHLHQLMSSNAPMMKMDLHGDPRIIPFGRWLRSSGLDELPQLINVLRGEMSLVGPRPCLPYESEEYLPWQRERFDALPGLSGLWQVSGKNRTTFVEMMRFDIEYARNKGWWLDLKIILKTIPALMIQMWESRKKQKSLSRKVRAEGDSSDPRHISTNFSETSLLLTTVMMKKAEFKNYHAKTN